MKIDYIFPRRIFSSKNSARAKFLTECKMDLKFTAPINIKFIKCLRTNVFSVDFWRRRNQALSYLFFTKTWLQALMLQIKPNGISLFLRNLLPAEEKRRNKCHKTKLGNRYLVHIGKKNEIWPHFTKKNDPFQKIAADVAVEEKYPTMIHFLRELFAKTAV